MSRGAGVIGDLIPGANDRGLGLKGQVVAGSTAGALTCTGIRTRDQLLFVWRLDLDATAANIDIDDLTSEFSVTDTDEITNTTTNTTGDKLLVLWWASTTD